MQSTLRVCALLALGLLAACTSKESTSGGGGGTGTDITVQFNAPASATDEAQTPWGAVVELSDTHTEDIQLNFFWSGNAQEFVDYTVTSIPPVTIPAGVQSLTLVFQLFEDLVGELDEQFTVTLVQPTNANLGAITKHTITIIDDDAVQFPEVEPNDTHLAPNVVGDMAPGLSWLITGLGVPPATNWDVFQFTPTADATVHVSLDPISAVSEAILQVLDADGNVVILVDDDQPGTTVSAIFNAKSGEVFFLVASVEGAGSGYCLEAIGV